jgi:competence protein ComFB
MSRKRDATLASFDNKLLYIRDITRYNTQTWAAPTTQKRGRCTFVGQLQLRNYTEEAVRMYMDRWFKEADVCQCESCRLDVMAIMLNNLAPKYVVTDKGALYAQLNEFDPQNKIDFMTAMTQAVKLVKMNPKH